MTMRCLPLLAGVLAALAVLVPAPPALSQVAPAPLFRTADRCMACHNGLVTPAGRDVSIGAEWRASMMANSARDPYWQAAVRRETIDHPRASDAIEAECSICHMPMMHTQARAAGATPEVFAHLLAAQAPGGATPAGALAADGVSCAACHQIADRNLGTRESFVGGFVVDPVPANAAPRIYGPFAVDSGRSRIMHSATGFRPTQSAHLASSELCATCHTLYTHALGPDGEIVGELPEQVPYLEWRHSDHAPDRTCQSCHMPRVEQTAITSVLPQPRPKLDRHSFWGGNFFMLRMLSRYAAELGVIATPGELDAAIERTTTNLRSRSARLTVDRMATVDGELVFEVLVENLAGHKLPTAYPSRRAWLHVTVRDAAGRVVFESGALAPDGSVAGNDNDADPARYEPHHEEIRSADQVQIYEGILAGPDGAVTTGLLTATRFVKDNRVLPTGFDPATAEEDIAVQGAAARDPDFVGGSDRVRYAIRVAESAGPYEIAAELWYQPIAFRWARNLAPYRAAETERFVRYYDSMSNASALLLTGDRKRTGP